MQIGVQLSHLHWLGSLEKKSLRNQVERRGLGVLGGTSGLLGSAEAVVTLICHQRLVAISPQGGLARPPTGWVGGRWTGLFWFWRQGLESLAVSKPQTPPPSKHFPLRQQSPWLPSQPLPLASSFLHPLVAFWLGKTCPSISFLPSLSILLSFFLPVLVLCSFMID